MNRPTLPTVALIALWAVAPASGQSAREPADPLDGPPIVSAKSWAVADGASGELLWGSAEAESRPMASTTKVMTAWIVLDLARKKPEVLDEIVVFSERAARTTGSSSKLQAGERLPVRELLYGLLLPSGNDAAAAFAEHFGPRLAGEGGRARNPADAFIAEMNRRAKELGMAETNYEDPHGLSRENRSSTRDLAKLAATALTDERFRGYVGTRTYRCRVTGSDGKEREVIWENTNRLLGIEGFDGVKTGTTTPAGNCLISSGRRGDDHLIVVVLGSTSTDGRYIDTRNLFRWAWRERDRQAGGR